MYIIDYDANPCCGRYYAVIFNAEPFLLTKLLHRIQLAIFPCHDQVSNCPVADQRSMNTSQMLLIPGTGNGERGTGNGERGTGNGERGTGNREQESGN